MNAVCPWQVGPAKDQVGTGQGQVVTEEIWKEAVHAAAAAAAIHDKASLLALWQWLAQNLQD